ncbi:MAG TPA: DUF2203 domain-containing protein [Phycisphaerae bacterium]|nr:DUF2203 domain-containing protein [Phycisphaerae bacterium]
MKPDNAAAQFDSDASSTRRFFTVESANRSLVLVRKVVADFVAGYKHLMELRRRQERVVVGQQGERLAAERAEIEQVAERLRALNDELADVGCELKDAAVGLVDFPAMREGRRVCLCWKLDEPSITHWHEESAGYAGRQPIDDGFEAGR